MTKKYIKACVEIVFAGISRHALRKRYKMKLDYNTLGIDIGSTTVKIAILDKKLQYFIFLITRDTLPIYRKHWQQLYKKPLTALEIYSYPQ